MMSVCVTMIGIVLYRIIMNPESNQYDEHFDTPENGGSSREERQNKPDNIISLQEYKKTLEATNDMDEVAKILDDYHLDGLIGLTGVDLLGTIAMTVFSLVKAKKANLGFKEKSKMIARQIVDGVIGSIPIAGDIADFFLKSNKKSAKYFHKKRDEMEARLLREGLSREDIQQIRQLVKEEQPFIDQSLQAFEDKMIPLRQNTRSHIADVFNQPVSSQGGESLAA